MPDLLFDEYESLGPLGHGAFADVYKVRHKELDYIRAIKVLHPLIFDKEEIKYKKFLKECQLLLRLGNGSQDNIVHIARPRLLNNHAIVEMEYIEGVDFNKYVEETCGGFVPMQEVYGLLEDIGGALAYCHYDIYKYCISADDKSFKPNENGILAEQTKSEEELVKKYKVLHNDIHSKNVMRRDDGKYILLDFGLALTADEEAKSSLRKAGAPEYKPPEKWDNELLLSEQSDIYSFGILMYEALTGAVPFCMRGQSNADELALMKDHQNTKPLPAEALRKKAFEERFPGSEWKKDYPDWLEVLIMKCLEKRPEDRYRNGKELFLEIQRSRRDDRQGEHIGSTDLRDNIEALTKENTDSKQKVADLDRRILQLVVSLNDAKKTTAEKGEETELLAKKNKQLEAAISGFKLKIADLERENNNLKERVKDVVVAGSRRSPRFLSLFVIIAVLVIVIVSWLNWPLTSARAADIVTETKTSVAHGNEVDADELKDLKKVVKAFPLYKDSLTRCFAEKAIGLSVNPASEKYKNLKSAIIALLDKSSLKKFGSNALDALGIKATSYYGETRNGLPDGFGISDQEDITTYIGTWKQGVKEGWGVRINKKYVETYEGDWDNNMANGQGVFFSQTDDIAENLKGCRKYVGDFKNGNKEGFGRCYDADDKLIYEGQFANDKPVDVYPNR